MSGILEELSNYSLENGIGGKVTKLSYIDRLFPHLGKNPQVLLVSKLGKEDKIINESISKTVEKSKLEETTEFEVTGSPLEHDFGDDSFNASITQVKRNWMKDEELYLPIPRILTTGILNKFQEDLDNGMNPNWKKPVFGLVKPTKNEDNLVLLGFNPIPNWFITMRGLFAGKKGFDKIQADLDIIMKDHMNAHKTKDVSVNVSSVYEIFGSSYSMTDFNKAMKSEFPGFLKVEANWNSFSFVPPLMSAQMTLTMEIASGSKLSPLSELWEEILLLDKYLSIFQDYQAKGTNSRYTVSELKFPRNFETPYLKDSSKILEQLEGILSGVADDDFVQVLEKDLVIDPASNDEEYEIKLSSIVEALGKRQNIDFIDELWQVLRSADNCKTIIDCLYLVFEKIIKQDYKPRLYSTDDTRFASMVDEINPEKPHAPQLAGSLSLEIVIDIGMKKLDRDFSYLLSVANLMEAQEFKNIIGTVNAEEFNVNKYREKLMKLAEIHLSLEFLNLIQLHFDNCRWDISQKLFEAALKSYRGTKSPLEASSLQDNNIYTLSLPAPSSFITEISKKAPSFWTCTLTSEQQFGKYISTTNYSNMPIFPPNIYEDEDENLNEEEGEIYYVTKAITIMTRFGC